jgi:hypothetical protein
LHWSNKSRSDEPTIHTKPNEAYPDVTIRVVLVPP